MKATVEPDGKRYVEIHNPLSSNQEEFDSQQPIPISLTGILLWMPVSRARGCSDANRAIVKNVYMDLRLGHATYQPLAFKMDSRGEINLSLPGPTWSNYQAFYQNVPKSTIAVGNVSFGNSVGNAPTNVGAQNRAGDAHRYLDFKSTSLPR